MVGFQPFAFRGRKMMAQNLCKHVIKILLRFWEYDEWNSSSTGLELILESRPIWQGIQFHGIFFWGFLVSYPNFRSNLNFWLPKSPCIIGELRGVDFSTQSGVVHPPNRVEVAAKDIRLVVDEGETAIYFHHGSGMVSWVSKQTLQGRGKPVS